MITPTIYITYADEPRECLERAVNSAIRTNYPVEVIDNSFAQNLLLWYPPSRFTVLTPTAPLTPSQTLWYLTRGGVEFFWLHCDGEILKPNTPDRLIEMIPIKDDWGVIFTHYDVFALYNAKSLLVKDILPDYLIDWYHFDIDWYYRMRLANLATIPTEYGPDVLHHGGSTALQKLARDAKRRHFDSRGYYMEKWGGDIHKETFKIPWNGLT